MWKVDKNLCLPLYMEEGGDEKNYSDYIEEVHSTNRLNPLRNEIDGDRRTPNHTIDDAFSKANKHRILLK